MRELEESLESRLLELEEENDELCERADKAEGDNVDIRREMDELRAQMMKTKGHAVSNEQYDIGGRN